MFQSFMLVAFVIVTSGMGFVWEGMMCSVQVGPRIGAALIMCSAGSG
jgi:hypothetical protein